MILNIDVLHIRDHCCFIYVRKPRQDLGDNGVLDLLQKETLDLTGVEHKMAMAIASKVRR